MAQKKETVYLKADRNIEVEKRAVTLGDVLKIESVNPILLAKLKAIRLLKFQKESSGRPKKQERQAVSILKVIELIHEEYPDVEIENVGESDFIVTYEEQKSAGGIWHYLKAAGVVAVSFTGAAFSIMAFNNDVDTVKLFGQIYELLTGRASDGFTVLELTYCIGLVIGILTFFNHFGKKRFTVDPTPMEVEMRLYENDLQTTMIENFSRKEKELDVGSTDTHGSDRP
ncbi:MAG: stage V sporulation protein AA [Dorea phocaeensis]